MTLIGTKAPATTTTTRVNFELLQKKKIYIRVFFHGHWILFFHRAAWQGRDDILFYSSTSKRSQTFRQLFETLHVRWLSPIFNRIACIYQAACHSMRFITLLNFHLIDWWCDLISVCILDNLILDFVASCIDYHPCITKQTN